MECSSAEVTSLLSSTSSSSTGVSSSTSGSSTSSCSTSAGTLTTCGSVFFFGLAFSTPKNLKPRSSTNSRMFSSSDIILITLSSSSAFAFIVIKFSAFLAKREFLGRIKITSFAEVPSNTSKIDSKSSSLNTFIILVDGILYINYIRIWAPNQLINWITCLYI